jgi:hypothetical protein
VQQQLATLADTQHQQQQHSAVHQLSGSVSGAAGAAGGRCATATTAQQAKASALGNGDKTGAVVDFAADDAEVPFIQYRWVIKCNIR